MVAGHSGSRRHTSLIIEKPKHEWIPDSTRSSCTHCSTAFTLFTRRHHCRSCGDIFCSTCSDHTAPVKVGKGLEPRVVRVCQPCWKLTIQTIQSQSQSQVSSASSMAPVSTPSTTSTPSATTSSSSSPSPLSQPLNIRLLVLLALVCVFITWILFFPSHCYSSFDLLSLPSRISVDVCSTHSLPLTTSFLVIAIFQFIIIGKMLHSKHEQKLQQSQITSSTPVAPTTTVATTSSQPQQRTYSPRDQQYISLVNYCMEELIKLTTSNDGWSVHATRDDITILQRNVGPTRNGLKARKIFRGDCIITGCTPTSLLQLLLQLFPERNWDKAVDGYTRLFQINDDVDVTHCVAAPAAGGTVAGRDFVDIRSTRKLENGYVTGGIGIPDYPVPPVKNVVRGINGIAGYGLFAVPNNPNACRASWVMDSKLNGWLPQSVIDMSLSTVMLDTLTNIRAVVASRPHMAYRAS